MIYTKNFLKCLIVALLFTNSILGQDKMYLNDGKSFGINLRTSDIKKGLFIVPKYVNGNQVLYNYTRLDVEKIITKDSNLVKTILNFDYELGRLFAFTNAENKTIFYADHWNNLNVLKAQKKDAILVKKKNKIIANDSIQKAFKKLDFKFGLRLTNTMSIFSFDEKLQTINPGSNYIYQTTTKKLYLTFFSPSFGFSYLGKRKNLHDFELGIISKTNDFNQTQITTSQSTFNTSGTDKNKFGISLFYRFSYFFFKNSKSKFLPSFGLGIGAIFEHSSINPLLKTSLPTSIFSISMPIYIEPTLNYFISNNCFLFLAIPIKINQLTYKNTYLDNPIIPLDLRRTVEINGDTFFKTDIWSLRLGLVVKLK